MPHPVVSGMWSNVVTVSYAVPMAVARAYLPPGPGGMDLELDTRSDITRHDSSSPSAVLSVVGLQASNIRVYGVKWPLLNRFDAMYARLYVRQGNTKGVVYIREFTGSRVMASGGRRTFNQPMVVTPMGGPKAEVKQQTLLIGAEYRLSWPRDGFDSMGRTPKGAVLEEYAVRVVGQKPPTRPGAKALESWLKDRPFVFGCLPPEKGGKGFVYEVIHPQWGVYPSIDCTVQMDFSRTLGPDWGFLSGVRPVHAMIATGSEFAIFPKRDSVDVKWGVKRRS